MRKSVVVFLAVFCAGSAAYAAGTIVTPEEQRAIPLEETLSASQIKIAPQTPKEVLADALSEAESATCAELSNFLHDTVLTDKTVMTALENRNAADVAEASRKYAVGAAKDLNADYLFYMPNPRFFVRVNDKNYRGRMRLPRDYVTAFSACYWENLPSGDVVYSVLLRVSDDFPGYFKLSKTLPNMISNVPDAMSKFGKVRLYTTLNKDNFRKRNWVKMRRQEPNKPEEFCWCSKENFAFLSTIGNGPVIPKKRLRQSLAAIEEEQAFTVPEKKAAGDAVMIKTVDGMRLGAVAYLIETP